MRGEALILLKYMALQIPGLALAATVLTVGVQWWELSTRTALLLFGLWVLKDIALYPVLKVAYAPGPGGAGESLLGVRGKAQEELAGDGEGYVRVGAELWRARLVTGAAGVARGQEVVVCEVRGLTLLVTPAAEDSG